MTLKQMIALFKRDDGVEYDEFLKDENIAKDRRLHRRAAFLLLGQKVPSKNGEDIVSAAEDDQIFLATDPKKLAKVATEEDILDLIRCGVMYDESNDCLAMFA